MNNFEQKFKDTILLKYGNKRDKNNDNLLLDDNNKKIKIDVDSIRKDFNEDVFTIDPHNCQDADDAFSIYTKDNKLYLAIHIADPTHYISLNSLLWTDVLSRGITHYPSNNLPIHMLPEEILHKSSLMTYYLPQKKRAITITYEINKNTYLPTNNINIDFTFITVKKENQYSYKKASNEINNIFDLGLIISQKLKKERSRETIGTKLSDIDFLSINYENTISIDHISSKEKKMKEMIAEFAILTNSFIGEFIMINIDGMGIFRTCTYNTTDNLSDVNLSGEELLDKIIKNGIKGSYSENNQSHDLVGKELYCHFTSPMRRATDCICHYMIKCYFLDLHYPWNKTDLNNICNNIIEKTHKEKKIQFDDIKFRTIQLISFLLPEYNVKLQCVINSYSGLFLNSIINKLILESKEDYSGKNKYYEFNIHISHTLKKRGLNIDNYINNYFTIPITHVNIPNKFDEGIFVELDSYLKNII